MHANLFKKACYVCKSNKNKNQFSSDQKQMENYMRENKFQFFELNISSLKKQSEKHSNSLFCQNIQYLFVKSYLIRIQLFIFLNLMNQVLSQKFMNIESAPHKFSQEIQMINFPVTYLHYHNHVPVNLVLVYKNDFSKAQYATLSDASKFYPCSWYLDNKQQSVAYEFCDEKIQFSQNEIKQRLRVLEEKGYQNYGTTIRPIRDVVQFETNGGHIYLSRDQFKIKPKHFESQTASNGKKMDSCYSYSTCVITSTYAHCTDYGHDVY